MQEETKVNKEEEVALDGMLFFDELNDVFPNEITELPPVREVNHAIP